jgi:hypothetical protein
VDNRDDELLDLLPSEEALVRLYELTERFGLHGPRLRGAETVSEQHAAAHGHRLTYGCCRGGADAA